MKARTPLTLLALVVVCTTLTVAGSATQQRMSDLGMSETVPVDVQPFNCSNTLRFNGRDVLPVALLGSESLAIWDLDLTTLQLEGVSARRWMTTDVGGPAMGEECRDTTPDGIRDLVLQFDLREVIAALAPVTSREERTVTLTGARLDGSPITGSDVVVVLGSRGIIEYGEEDGGDTDGGLTTSGK